MTKNLELKEEEKRERIPVTRTFVVFENKVLLLQTSASKGSRFEFPGGKVVDNIKALREFFTKNKEEQIEMIRQATLKEIKEEVGIEIDGNSVGLLGYFEDFSKKPSSIFNTKLYSTYVSFVILEEKFIPTHYEVENGKATHVNYKYVNKEEFLQMIKQDEIFPSSNLPLKLENSKNLENSICHIINAAKNGTFKFSAENLVAL